MFAGLGASAWCRDCREALTTGDAGGARRTSNAQRSRGPRDAVPSEIYANYRGTHAGPFNDLRQRHIFGPLRLPLWVNRVGLAMSALRPLAPRLCCKSRFSPMTKILRAVGATFVYKMRGTSRPHAKFTGDFGNAIEVIQISDRSLLSVFAKNLEPCNFRVLQHNPPESRHASGSSAGPFRANGRHSSKLASLYRAEIIGHRLVRR